MFKKILIANRGEIAVRVMRTCRDMGITPVAVYSEADRGALHVLMSDEAHAIGPARPAESYLSIEKIIAAARKSGVDAIHPGYGFLSENAAFAQACEDSGLVFIGPSATSIALMGSKVESRRAVSQFAVPMVPGTIDPVADEDEARRIARTLGFPLMLKASAGGGGKGLRFVASEAELSSAWRDTRAEAKAAFGDDAVYIEKFAEEPRHIEIQVLADRHGHAIYLGERECSIQRRHQKVIEECPSPIMDPGLRQRMGEAALNVVRAAGYYNAGTVEFLVDRNRQFYFLEMNTRIQVEHPVTEMVTLADIVRNQIRIASGEDLQYQQEDVQIVGHSIECRINAEDPVKFTPSPGRITAFNIPGGPGVRVDTAVYPGYVVPPYYDSMIAKLIVHARTRELAITRMQRALDMMVVEGIKTTIPLHKKIMADKKFQAGDFSTKFMEEFEA